MDKFTQIYNQAQSLQWIFIYSIHTIEDEVGAEK